MNRRALLLSVILAGGILPAHALAQQAADSTFHPIVARPAFVDKHPRILFDESHHNFHTLGGRYRAFGELAERDGCLLTPGTRPFAAETLAGFEILVIANAAGDDLESGTDSTVALSAFTPRTWPWYSRLTRRARSRLWSEPSDCSPCGSGTPSDELMTIIATGSPASSPHSTWPAAR